MRVNAELFIAYIEQVLAPVLRRRDTVIMDNLPVHKVPAIRSAIEAAGAKLLYLPSYSPDLNPIEMVFAKMKAELRREAHRAIDALWRAPRPHRRSNYPDRVRQLHPTLRVLGVKLKTL